MHWTWLVLPKLVDAVSTENVLLTIKESLPLVTVTQKPVLLQSV